MKALLILFLALIYSTSRAQDIHWRLGESVTEIKDGVLGEPGFSLSSDEQKSEHWRTIIFQGNDSEVGFNFSFYDNICLYYKALLYGVHDTDIDERYASLKRLNKNTWMDDKRNIKVYIHRRYNGKFTELFIDTIAPD